MTFKWQAAVGAARSASRPAKILFIGDSNVAGQGAGTGVNNTTNARIKSFPVIAAAKLNSKVSKATVDSFFGDQNITPAGGPLPAYDPRISFGTGWAADVTPATLGGRWITVAGVSAGDLVFSPAGAFDRFTVFYPTAPGASSSLTVKVDGAGVGTINQAAANSYASTTFSTTLGAHAIGFNNATAGQAFVAGVMCWSSADPGIVMLQAGWCGCVAGDLLNMSLPWEPMGAMSVVQPDLTVVYCTINDCNANTSLATYSANMEMIVQQAANTGDVLIVGGFPSNGPNTYNGTLDAYMAALHSIAANHSAGIIDLRDEFGINWTIANQRGYTADSNHPSIGGHAMIGGIIADAVYVP